MKPIQQALMRHKLAWSIVVLVVAQVQGGIPALDFIPPLYYKFICFALGCLLSVAKGIEMYFERVVQIEDEPEAPPTNSISQSNQPTKKDNNTYEKNP